MPTPKFTATASLLIAAAVFLAALPHQSVAAPAPLPSPGLDCFPYLINISDCLSFVESGSNLTEPDKGCCPELAQLVNTQPVCLCQLLGRPAQVGIPLDINRALKMPSACNVSTPPVSLCARSGGDVASPAPSEFSADANDALTGSGTSTAAATAHNGTPNTLPSYLFAFAPLLLIYCFF